MAILDDWHGPTYFTRVGHIIQVTQDYQCYPCYPIVKIQDFSSLARTARLAAICFFLGGAHVQRCKDPAAPDARGQ